MTRNALNVAKVRGKIDPGDFRSVVSFLTRVIVEKRLRGDLFTHTARAAERIRGGKRRLHGSRNKPKRIACRK
jgi:hypothetical protein